MHQSFGDPGTSPVPRCVNVHLAGSTRLLVEVEAVGPMYVMRMLRRAPLLTKSCSLAKLLGV